jgi:Helix-turn-helix domain
MHDPVMTVELAAAWFGVSPSTVRSWVADRKIESVGKIGNAKLYPFRTLCEVDRETRLSHNLRKARFGRHTAF